MFAYLSLDPADHNPNSSFPVTAREILKRCGTLGYVESAGMSLADMGVHRVNVSGCQRFEMFVDVYKVPYGTPYTTYDIRSVRNDYVLHSTLTPFLFDILVKPVACRPGEYWHDFDEICVAGLHRFLTVEELIQHNKRSIELRNLFDPIILGSNEIRLYKTTLDVARGQHFNADNLVHLTLDEAGINEHSLLYAKAPPKERATGITQIFVKYPCGTISNTISVTVDLNESVYKLKEIIAAKTHIPLRRQCLLFCSVQLQEFFTVSSYGVSGESTVQVVAGLRGRMPPNKSVQLRLSEMPTQDLFFLNCFV